MYFVRFLNALLPTERKQRLVSEGTAPTKSEILSNACNCTYKQGVWSPEISSKVGSGVKRFYSARNMGNGWSYDGGLVATQLGTGPL